MICTRGWGYSWWWRNKHWNISMQRNAGCFKTVNKEIMKQKTPLTDNPSSMFVILPIKYDVVIWTAEEFEREVAGWWKSFIFCVLAFLTASWKHSCGRFRSLRPVASIWLPDAQHWEHPQEDVHPAHHRLLHRGQGGEEQVIQCLVWRNRGLWLNWQ